MLSKPGDLSSIPGTLTKGQVQWEHWNARALTVMQEMKTGESPTNSRASWPWKRGKHRAGWLRPNLPEASGFIPRHRGAHR